MARDREESRNAPTVESGAPLRVLVVDDDPDMRRSMQRVLTSAGMDVLVAEDGNAGLEVIETSRLDVVLTDLHMPGRTGAELLEAVRAAGHDVEVVIMTAHADIALSVQLVKAGAFGFLTKPFPSTDVVVVEIRNAGQLKRLRTSAEELRRELAAGLNGRTIIGSSAPMAEVRRLISGVATSSSTVLVLGESGTGKELVARAIHEQSTRAGKRFIAVNCGAIPNELVDSELFGHTRGAFTSAVSSRAGLFEAAHGGTLFLDEVGDLPLPVQVKLLRTLQLGEVRPVGSDTTKTVDVRVIAATNADLRAAIAAGTFRQDLFYRLNVVAIRVPPLRERGHDVQLLALHFLREHALRLERVPPALSREVLDAILAYPWPGNVRELAHAMERAVILSPGADVLDVSALPPDVREHASVPSTRPDLDSDADLGTIVKRILRELGLGALTHQRAKQLLLTEFNRAYVADLLEKVGGNVTEAAKLAGLDRSNFRRLMRMAVDVAKPPSRDD